MSGRSNGDDNEGHARLNVDDVREWAKAAQSGDPVAAADAMADAYVRARPFIVFVSMRAAKPGLDREDMVAAGIEGFVTALTRFNYESPSAKLGFIGSYIRNYVLKECARHSGAMSSSYSSYSRDNRIKALRNALELDGRDATPQAIADISTDPKFSRAGYGRKRKDGSDRQPVPITVNQVKDFLRREQRVFSDINGLDVSSPEDRGQYSDLVEVAREIAERECEHPELVMETFEHGEIPLSELKAEGVTRSQLRADIEKMLSTLRSQMSADDFM